MADIRLAIAEGRFGDFAARDPRASLGPAETTETAETVGPTTENDLNDLKGSL